ncbi:MAG TPA: cyclase family protein [Oligoflexus sp.]|nr:cyclase family protein [Oligoflexus sp.]HYX38892.1 cyclase family protein [Oligoflexus sp.]
MRLKLALLTSAFLALTPAGAQQLDVGISPWGKQDELGRMNLMTDASRAAVLKRIQGGRSYDLSVEYFIGMPSWHAIGDPRYQFWLTHTPRGTAIDDPMQVGHSQNQHVGYTGSAFSMYSHMGTHIDALNHFGLNGKIWNGFRADEHLGDRGWKKTGAETIPPIIARGVMLDIAALKGVRMLAEQYRITKGDVIEALKKQKVSLQNGDVVLIRTGRMQVYQDEKAFIKDPPGMSLEAAQYLIEEGKAMMVGADNLSFETFPSEVAGNYVPLHTYLLAQKGAPILELVYLEDLAKDKVYEFAFIAGSLKLKGADAAPVRPIAIPIK